MTDRLLDKLDDQLLARHGFVHLHSQVYWTSGDRYCIRVKDKVVTLEGYGDLHPEDPATPVERIREAMQPEWTMTFTEETPLHLFSRVLDGLKFMDLLRRIPQPTYVP